MGDSRIAAGLLVHVPQRTPNDCVIAAAATVANVAYDVAASRSPVTPGTRGLVTLEALGILEAVTGVRWRIANPGWFRTVAWYAGAEHPLVLIARRPWRRQPRHCVTVQGGWVYDPGSPDGCRVGEYFRRSWRVDEVYRTADPEQLRQVQGGRLWERCVRLE